MEPDADTPQQYAALSPESLRQMGLRIATERDSRGWTQRELGRRAGLSSSRLSRLERGHCEARLRELAGLRNTLGIDLDELVFGRPPEAPASRLERLAHALAEVGDPPEIAVVERLIQILLHKEESPE